MKRHILRCHVPYDFTNHRMNKKMPIKHLIQVTWHFKVFKKRINSSNFHQNFITCMAFNTFLNFSFQLFHIRSQIFLGSQLCTLRGNSLENQQKPHSSSHGTEKVPFVASLHGFLEKETSATFQAIREY